FERKILWPRRVHPPATSTSSFPRRCSLLHTFQGSMNARQGESLSSGRLAASEHFVDTLPELFEEKTKSGTLIASKGITYTIKVKYTLLHSIDCGGIN
ncbi:hypothetical protein U9M48_035738, partial [Paspalum notatum var. saurae]